MRLKNSLISLVSVVLLLGVTAGLLNAAEPVSIRGKVTAKEGPLEGAYIGAHAEGKTYTTYVMTNSSGEFVFRGLTTGTYAVFTRIPGFRKVVKEKITVQEGKEAKADFQVVPETDFMTLVNQATNSELMESIPLPQDQKKALDARCLDRCHGASYFVGTRLSADDWMLIVKKMEQITPVADPLPPIARPNQTATIANTVTDTGIYGTVEGGGTLVDDNHIVQSLAKISGPNSPYFPIKFQPRATGKLTRAVVTEYQIPRTGAFPHDVLLDPRGRYAWYNDWRANIIGRVDMETGEIKEYPIPGRDDRPGGFHTARWDNQGNLWLGQLWSGRVVRFDVKAEKVTGSWGVPQEWARTGTVVVCSKLWHPDGPVWTQDALLGNIWKLNPDTSVFTPVKDAKWNICDSQGNLYGFESKGVLRKTEPGLMKHTDYRTPTPGAIANENRIQVDSSDNVWYGVWEPAQIGYLDTHAGKITEFAVQTPWAHGYNAIGDGVHKIGWSVPHMADRMIKADVNTGQVTEIPLPSRAYQMRNLDLEMSANPPAVWFINERDGSVVRFQEYTEE